MLTQALLCWRVMVASAQRRGDRIATTNDFTPRDTAAFATRNHRLRTEALQSFRAAARAARIVRPNVAGSTLRMPPAG